MSEIPTRRLVLAWALLLINAALTVYNAIVGAIGWVIVCGFIAGMLAVWVAVAHIAWYNRARRARGDRIAAALAARRPPAYENPNGRPHPDPAADQRRGEW